MKKPQPKTQSQPTANSKPFFSTQNILGLGSALSFVSLGLYYYYTTTFRNYKEYQSSILYDSVKDVLSSAKDGDYVKFTGKADSDNLMSSELTVTPTLSHYPTIIKRDQTFLFIKEKETHKNSFRQEREKVHTDNTEVRDFYLTDQIIEYLPEKLKSSNKIFTPDYEIDSELGIELRNTFSDNVKLEFPKTNSSGETISAIKKKEWLFTPGTQISALGVLQIDELGNVYLRKDPSRPYFLTEKTFDEISDSLLPKSKFIYWSSVSCGSVGSVFLLAGIYSYFTSMAEKSF